jgi:cytochrome b
MTTPITTENPGGLSQPSAAAQVRVWDPLVRVFHWALVAAFAVAFIVEDELLGLHVWTGYLALTLIGVRVLWGLIGTRHARFTDFVRGPSAVIAYIKEALLFKAPRYLGHNPAGGAMVIALLLSVAATGLTGWIMVDAQGLGGEEFEEVHEFFAFLSLGLIAAHVAGVLFASFAHQENLIGAMITGNKRRED